ncbi:MAG: hypothetical protein EBZ74_01745 [Planctomycetia bacterium]|nr:hypothetical protein [Planctomycetia bacterium]
MARTAFILGEILFLAIAQVCGGPPWTLVGVAAFLLAMGAGPRGGTIALLAPALVWLGLSRATGDREFFFPYTMHLAAAVACGLGTRGPAWGLAGGGGVVATFLAIRSIQQATARVLAVEFAVAAAILAGVTAMRVGCPRRRGLDAAIVAAAALLAWAGLAL